MLFPFQHFFFLLFLVRISLFFSLGHVISIIGLTATRGYIFTLHLLKMTPSSILVHSKLAPSLLFLMKESRQKELTVMSEFHPWLVRFISRENGIMSDRERKLNVSAKMIEILNDAKKRKGGRFFLKRMKDRTRSKKIIYSSLFSMEREGSTNLF